MRNIALGVLAILLGLSACEGGCGDPAPQQAPSSEGGQTTSGGSSGGGGSATIPLTPRDKKRDTTLAQATPGSGTEPDSVSAKPPATPKGPAEAKAPEVKKLPGVVEAVPADFGAKVLKNASPVLVVFVTPTCKACASVEFALSSLAAEYPKTAFVKLDLTRPGGYELLPTGLRRLPLPAFAFYQDGMPSSIRQGLPVPADSSSRLKAWLKKVIEGRDARL